MHDEFIIQKLITKKMLVNFNVFIASMKYKIDC